MKEKRIIGRYLFFIICILTMLLWRIPALAGSEVDDINTLTIGIPADRCPLFYLDDETGEPIGIAAAMNAVFWMLEE